MKTSTPTSKIAEFYAKFPFPNIVLNKKEDIYNTFIFKLINGLTKKYLENYPKKKIKILDVGCGTGELTLGLATPDREILGIDINKKSIEIAKKRALKFKVKNVEFKHFDFVKENLPKNFDFIFSIGVLHHTEKPEENFNKLVKSLKKGGFITIGIYNPFGSFKVRIKRGILKVIAGNNFEKKIEIYRKLFYRRKLTLMEEVAVADAFANPYRRYYTFEQLYKWFNRNKIEYLASTPPVEWSKNIILIKEILKRLILRKNIDLMEIWQKITYETDSEKKEIGRLRTLLTQLSWLPTGRGELINIVGRKK